MNVQGHYCINVNDLHRLILRRAWTSVLCMHKDNGWWVAHMVWGNLILVMPSVLVNSCITLIYFMMTSSNGNIFRVTGPFVRAIHRWPVNSFHKGQWRGALMFSFTCVWINGWVNKREAGNERRHRPHYDVIVMFLQGLYSLTGKTSYRKILE